MDTSKFVFKPSSDENKISKIFDNFYGVTFELYSILLFLPTELKLKCAMVHEQEEKWIRRIGYHQSSIRNWPIWDSNQNPYVLRSFTIPTLLQWLCFCYNNISIIFENMGRSILDSSWISSCSVCLRYLYENSWIPAIHSEQNAQPWSSY